VTSSFTGEDLVLFGTVEPDNARTPLRPPYDLLVTVAGPRETMRTRRKERVLGIWVNYDSRVFEKVPSYLAVLANRSLEAITNAETLRRLQIGLDRVALNQRAAATIADSAPDDPFRRAFLRLEGKRGFYREEPQGVTFLTPTLYRASIPLPAEVPIGNYEIDVKLFADGALIARTPSAFEVYKAGFEQVVTAAARDHGFLYGLATAAIALLTGWLASVVFRRD
jgi:uncharacterized protein (TIGR02186 family)